MAERKPNRLINETSPYLLQHAYNPVDWFPWGEEALKKAKAEDKPILVSIGYAACHWCHVMERESFEKDEVAELMNEHFVCIKVDREERPDVDHIYMDAVQAISGQGGWPLNMFLTPDAKPFYGGTYFPPVDGYGRPSWTQVLNSVHHAFTTNRAGIEDQASKLTSYLENNDNNLVADTQVKPGTGNGKKLFYEKDATAIFEELKKRFDGKNGGFGGAPKFPNTLNIQYLLLYHYHTQNAEALEQALLSLDKMICGGIYDQLGGGFSRYSTDDHWLAPHFEKMLYDNALLVTAICQAYQLTGNNLYRDTVTQTLSFIADELTSPEGGFYAALDADSEGQEGKYYVWDKAEIDEVLGEDAALFSEYYDVTDGGNWEEANILHIPEPLKIFAERKGQDAIKVYETLSRCRKKLLLRRRSRVMPGLDDKVILSWNAMMCSAYLKAYEAFGDDKYLMVAEKNVTFLLGKLLEIQDGQLILHHTYKNGVAKYSAFLDDHALLIEALIDLYESVFDERLLQVAEELAETVIRNFYDEATGQFYFTPVDQADIIVRKKELFDGVTPSGNSTMAYNLQRLAVITGREDFHDMATRMMKGISTSMLNYSASFTKWAMVALRYIYHVKEIAVVGPEYIKMAREIRRTFIPGRILMGSSGTTASNYPLLQERIGKGDTLIYLCENYTCQLPYRDVDSFMREIGK